MIKTPDVEILKPEIPQTIIPADRNQQMAPEEVQRESLEAIVFSMCAQCLHHGR